MMFSVSRGLKLRCQRVNTLLIGCGHVLESMFYAINSDDVIIIIISFIFISSILCLYYILFNL
jgi:hypothetical protein